VKTPVVYLSAMLLLVLLSTAGAVGDTLILSDRDRTSEEPAVYPVSLALSGGGARGLATIGILKAFEERNIRPVAIAGTSIGGIVGGLYAAGYSADDLRRHVGQFDFENLFSNRPERRTMFQTKRSEEGKRLFTVRFNGLRPAIPQGLTAGQRLTELLTRLTVTANYRSQGDFDRLPIPYRTICTDLVSGEKIVLRSGSLADAMRASMAFPLAFTPVELHGHLLMDGGMLSPLPVAEVQTIPGAASFVVAINTASPLLSRGELTTALDIANQATTIMTADKLREQAERADIVISPAVGQFQLTDFGDADSLIAVGYAAGHVAADSIITMLTTRAKSRPIRIAAVNCHTCPPLLYTASGAINGQTLDSLDLVSRLQQLRRHMDMGELMLTFDRIPSGVATDSGVPAYILSIQPHQPQTLSCQNARYVVEGSRLFPDSLLIQLLPDCESVITEDWLTSAANAILKPYRDLGYDLAHVTQTALVPESSLVRFFIDEAIIQRVNVRGNHRTRDWFVRSLLPLASGQPWSSDAADRGLRNVYGTNLFDRVTMDLTPTGDGAVLTVRVEEKPPTELGLGWHWHDEYESEQFLEIRDNNLLGMGLEFHLLGQYGSERQLYHGGFKLDRIWSTYLTARMQVYHSVLDRRVYDPGGSRRPERQEKINGVEFMLGQQIARFGTVSAGLVFEEVQETPGDQTNANRFGLRILELRSLVENFDRIPFTRRGHKHLVQVQFAGQLLGGKVEYTKFFTSHEVYLPLTSWLNYHPKVQVGFSRSGLPPSKRFFLGGAHSFFGYEHDQLSGEKVVLASQNVRLKLPLWLYLSLRYDFGDVYAETDQIKWRTLRHAVGATLSLDTPLGPVEASYGIVDSNHDQFYLHIGREF
jgi:NTE family protein